MISGPVSRAWLQTMLSGLLIGSLVGACAKTEPHGDVALGRSTVEAAWIPGAVVRDCNDDCPELVVLPPMIQADGSEIPPFAVGRYEVTVAEFRVFVADTGYEMTGECYFPKFSKDQSHLSDPTSAWDNPPFGDYHQSDRDAVTCVSWAAANDYAKWLARKTGKPYALPSQEQWEYAARAGTKSRFSWGEGNICDYANTFDSATTEESWARNLPYLIPCRDGYAYTAPVGSFLPNGFDLFDTAGNVAEWTTTCFQQEQTVEPNSNEECGYHVTRGGDWLSGVSALSPSASGEAQWNAHLPFIGFRVMRWQLPPPG
ncbi:formylglycine-generating enzyme family protein [Dongia sp.]|uniref:formylglycine-generating enzyme family protein n=1 Tax=Dongia sp. TaxID=1977262 RepID=UPI0037502EF5